MLRIYKTLILIFLKLNLFYPWVPFLLVYLRKSCTNKENDIIENDIKFRSCFLYAYYNKSHSSYSDQQNLETPRGFNFPSSKHILDKIPRGFNFRSSKRILDFWAIDFRKRVSQVSKSQRQMLIREVSSYQNAISFQGIR